MQNRAVLARKAQDRQGVRTIPRHFDVKDHLGLLQLGDVPHERTDGHVGRILNDAVACPTLTSGMSRVPLKMKFM